MRVSLKLQKEEEEKKGSILIHTKLPISIFNLPFLSSLSLSSSSPSSPTLSLKTHFPNGPSLKLSYSPSSPLSLSLSSGVSLSASPLHSPLTFSAHFSLLHSHSPSPSFSLLFNPRFGDFSIKKPFFSPKIHDSSPDSRPGSDINGFEVKGPLGSWKDSTLDMTRERSGVSEFSVWARTVLPVTRRVNVRFRWGVSFPSDVRKGGLPFLSLDKVGIERVEEEGGREDGGKKGVEEIEGLRGMCASVGREVEDLRRENREMRRCFEEMMRKENSSYGCRDCVSKRVANPLMVSEDLGEIEGWNKVKKKGASIEIKSNSNGDLGEIEGLNKVKRKGVNKEIKSNLNGDLGEIEGWNKVKTKGVGKEVKSSMNGVNELESEFQRAIMAASASR